MVMTYANPDQVSSDWDYHGVNPESAVLRDQARAAKCDDHSGTDYMDPKHPWNMTALSPVFEPFYCTGQVILTHKDEGSVERYRKQDLHELSGDIHAAAGLQPAERLSQVMACEERTDDQISDG